MPNAFHNISTNNKKKLLSLLESKVEYFTKNESILNNYTNENIVGIIEEGLIQVVKISNNGNTNIIQELSTNEVFTTDVNTFFSNTDIIALEDSKIIIIDYDYIIENLDNNKDYFNQFIKNLFVIMNEKILEKNERIQILTKKTIRNKFLEYLNLQSRSKGSRNIYLPYSYKDLADYLAVDRSALAREISSLRQEGFIETKGRKITILFDNKQK
ncbi:MAG: Crp/Fnr family transcriptional regulator [Bacilli bacterium]|nr:Crp/Fnr family transcriptional regulator [Bacilli bacterium]